MTNDLTPTSDAWVLDEFRDSNALLEGHFLLSSGRHSGVYLQCALVLREPDRAAKLVAAFVEKLKATGIAVDAVVAPAMGGLIVGYEVARQLNVPSMFTERVEGEFTFRRGFTLEKGTRVLMMEDVVTTGKSSRECIKTIEEFGGEVVAAGCLIDRSGGVADVGVPLVPLTVLSAPTYAPEDVPADLAKIPAVKPGSRGLKA